MPETVMCPSCNTKLQVATMPAPGKKLRCPKCKEAFAPNPPEEEEREEDERPSGRSPFELDDEDEEPRPKRNKKRARRESHTFEFDGSAGDYFVVAILTYLLIIFTFGLGFPWAMCMIVSWQAEHTLINGRRLRFDGAGISLLGLYLVVYLLTIITLGIYLFWGVPKMIRWFTENLEFQDAD